MSYDGRYSVQELSREFSRFEGELRAAGKKENTIRTYVDRSAIFARWLAGEFQPNEADRRSGTRE